jgi:hypothetical protein
MAAFANMLVPPTANNWIISTSYPPFGMIERAFLVLSSFLFSMGIYSAAISVSQDAKLRQLIRKHAKEARPLHPLASAQMEADIQGKVVKIVQEQAATMARETGVQSSMTDQDVKQYLDAVIGEISKRKDNY